MDSFLETNDIDSQYQEKISIQDYSPKETIDGVEFIELPHFVDDGGTFIEIARMTDGEHDWLHGLPARQVSFSEMQPGVTKAFHLHFKQDEVWFIPPSSRMLIGLVDVRAESPTKNAKMRFVMGGSRAKVVKIPRGVAHGVRNIGKMAGQIIYVMSQQFNKDEPDERRLPWDLVGADFWEVSKG